jgi:hypothetical protein
LKFSEELRKMILMFTRKRTKALIGVFLLLLALVCGLWGTLSAFLLLPPLFILGILWLAFLVHRRVLGCVLVVLLFVPMMIGGVPIFFLIIPPILLFTLLYLIAAGYFLLRRRPRKLTDAALFMISFALVLPPSTLNLPGPGYYIWVAGNLQPAMLSAFSNATLEVQVLAPDNSPISGLEVDLWLRSTGFGPPDAGRQRTDAGGVAVFRVIAGEYRVGFNMLNFPENYIPFDVPVTVAGTVRKIVQLQPRA